MSEDLIYAYVLEYFDGDETKANLWFHTPNPALGNITPDQMIEQGRTDRLLNFVQESIHHNDTKS